MNKKDDFPYQYYGSLVKAGELIAFLEHMLQVNAELEEAGRRRAPVCIWGRHGIGKTEIVEELARTRGFSLAYLAPAQFEEMGDLIGMPEIVGDEEVGEEVVTVFRPPDWVPSVEGPGILLIDDVNRADSRILGGIMQLLQDYRLHSWSLPPGWQIILTANPDGGDYQVTPMDDALLTRMLHITLQFDAREWARWADGAGVDPRGITFVLAYPETVTGHRTTPRSLTQFLAAVQGIADLNRELPLVRMLGEACLDEPTVAAFIQFVRQHLHTLPGPADLLAAEDFEVTVRQPLTRLLAGSPPRVDIMAAICTRLAGYLLDHDAPPGSREAANLRAFLLLDLLPNDLRVALARDLANSTLPGLQALVADPEVGKVMLQH